MSFVSRYVHCVSLSRCDHGSWDVQTAEKEGEKTGGSASNPSLIAQRAYHPDEIARSSGQLVVDYEWYLVNQILPPISRLCEPIEGTSMAILSQQLGLDSSKYVVVTGVRACV